MGHFTLSPCDRWLYLAWGLPALLGSTMLGWWEPGQSGYVKRVLVENSTAIPAEQAIEILRSLEARFRNVSYRAELQSGLFDDPDDLSKFRPATLAVLVGKHEEPPKLVLEAVLDYENARFRFTLINDVKNPRTNKPIKHRDVLAFDGTEYRGWTISEGDLSVRIKGPPEHFPTDTSVRQGYIDFNSRTTGAEAFFRHMRDFPPFEVYRHLPGEKSDQVNHKRVSEWIREKQESNELLSIGLKSENIWMIRWRETSRTEPKAQVIVESLCDLARGGIVVQKTYYYSTPDGKTRIPQQERKELVRLGEYWVPKMRGWMLRQPVPSAHGEELWWGQRWVYSELRVNERLSDDVFRPEFPKGTLVRDYVRKLTYVVGEPFEEREAVRRFMQEQGLAAPPETARRWSWWWWVGGIGLLVILLGLLLAWRWRRRRLLGTSSTSAP